MLLFYGLSESVLVKRNVVFQKVNEITTTRSRWLVTFVIDLNPYEQFLTKLENDFITSGTTTELSKLLTSCLTSVKNHVIRYCENVYERSGKNLFWSIKKILVRYLIN